MIAVSQEVHVAVAVTGWPLGALAPAPAVGPLARVLVERGMAGLPGALALLADSLSASAATLREVRPDGSPGQQHHSGGQVPRARAGGGTLDVPLRAGGRVVGLLTVHGLPAEVRVTHLTAAADVLALAVLGAQRDPVRVATELLLCSEADAETVAGILHDGPAQALLATRYQLELGANASDDLRAGVDEALRDVRATMSRLRTRRSDPGSDPGGDLGSDLGSGAPDRSELARRLVDQAGLEVAVTGSTPAGISDALAIVTYRLAQAAAFDAVARHARELRIALDAHDGWLLVAISDDGALGVPHQPWLVRWITRVAYLGGRVTTPPEGGLRVSLPLADSPTFDGGHP
ncbi:MAG: sensor histidine kinase [Mycobacteriales bacterium]